MNELAPFDANDYRKRVLAAVERRGGPDTSDVFELYDLPVDGDLDDLAVAERVETVWAAWQRQRDHPKYRVLVGLLVEGHPERSAELLDAGRRRAAAARVAVQRQQRDTARYELLDAAIARLVDRHGGVPRDKVEGLYEVGALAGLDRGEVADRLRQRRVIDPPGPAGEPGIRPERRRQVRALLDEFGRLTDSSAPAPPTLLALLGLPPHASPEQVRASAAAWRSRARELPPDRLRAVVDELLVHVGALVEPGRAAVEAYLAAVAADVADHLRPRVRAAVLVEDRLVADDHVHLLDEAVALGLDRQRATAVLAALVAELGTTIETAEQVPPSSRREPARPWEEPLKAARAALRTGRPAQAQRLVEQARRAAGADGSTPVRAVADEVAAVLADADLRWRAAATAGAARRWTEALEHLEHLARTAADIPGTDDREELLARARSEVERADRAVAAAEVGPESDLARALLAVLAACPQHPGALAALDRIPLAPPAWVSAVRDARGDVVVLWAASVTPEVTYRVSRCRPDGSWQVVGRVSGTSVEDGGAPPGVEAPVYAVAALQVGRTSVETRSDAVPEPTTLARTTSPAPNAVPPVPGDVRAVRAAGGSVEVSWTGHGDAEYRVCCLVGDGRWRVVGRTRATSMEDGGASQGPVPVYAVSAAAGGVRSAEGRSDGRNS